MKEFKDLRATLSEATESPINENVSVGMPPNILVLRRQSIRQFPNHTYVALYYNDKLDQYFSIPYGAGHTDTITPTSLKEEPEQLHEDAISHLHSVKEFQTTKPLRHKNGQQTKVDPTTAKALLTVHGALNDENKKKFSDHLEHSKEKFHKMVDFAWKQVK